MDKLIIKPIEYYTNSKENHFFERKSSRIKPLDILKHLVAFANSEGGQLVIGIEDNGDITGFKSDKSYSIEDYKNISLVELRETPILVKINELRVKNINNEDDKILIITVDFSSNRVIKSYDGKVYLRQTDKSKELKFEQILELQYDRGQRFFEDEIVEGSCIDDLDEGLLDEYKKIMDVPNIETESLLIARNLIKDGKLTNSAILLFGKNPTKYLPQARVRVIKYDGFHAGVGKDINIIKEKTFDGAIPLIIKEVKIFIDTQLRDFQYLNQEGKFDIMPEYPEFAWFEGIVNALVHRNYSIRGEHIKVILFDDRLEILSPGLLPNIVTVENILNQRYSRNPRIARFLTEFGWVKEMNEGVKRIYSEMQSFFLKKPKYSEPNHNVLLVLENNILNRSIRITEKLKDLIEDKIFDKLTSDEKLVLHFMYNTGEKMTTKLAVSLTEKGNTYCSKLLKSMKEKKLLNWRGSWVERSRIG